MMMLVMLMMIRVWDDDDGTMTMMMPMMPPRFLSARETKVQCPEASLAGGWGLMKYLSQIT